MREVTRAHDAPDRISPSSSRRSASRTAENADLYRKIGDLTHALKTEQARWS
ncbi:MAG: hypothetical protein ACRDOI_02810 [Trebonia sp.]